MKLEINIPDNIKDDVVETLSKQWNYQNKIADEKGEEIDNPESKGAFCKRMLIEYLKNNYKGQKRKEALANLEETELNIT